MRLLETTVLVHDTGRVYPVEALQGRLQQRVDEVVEKVIQAKIQELQNENPVPRNSG